MDKKIKTILVGGGAVALLGLVVFIFFKFSGSPAKAPTQEVVTKAQNKTYLKYVALENVSPTVVPLPTSEVTPNPTGTTLTSTPSPTEIIIALSTPTSSATEGGQTVAEPTTIAELPTTGIIQGSVVMFLIAASMIVFAFVL